MGRPHPRRARLLVEKTGFSRRAMEDMAPGVPHGRGVFHRYFLAPGGLSRGAGRSAEYPGERRGPGLRVLGTHPGGSGGLRFFVSETRGRKAISKIGGLPDPARFGPARLWIPSGT